MSTAAAPSPAEFELVERLTRDLRAAATTLGKREARYLVDLYISVQKFRMRSEAQVRASTEAPEPHRLLSWVYRAMATLESDIKRALDHFTDEYTVGLWLKSICGIGPVISAGLLAHLDIRQAKTAGHFWRFAGLDPTCHWEKKTKRPWNAQLKTLVAYKLGESFVKVQGRDSDYYGKVFAARKGLESARNLEKKFADQAAAILADKKIGRNTEAYKFYSMGMLPLAHIHARARRYAAKLLLAHLHEVMYWDWFETAPPLPYIFEHGEGDHRHRLAPPGWPVAEPGKSLREMGE